jgi:hypothetical protein
MIDAVGKNPEINPKLAISSDDTGEAENAAKSLENCDSQASEDEGEEVKVEVKITKSPAKATSPTKKRQKVSRMTEYQKASLAIKKEMAEKKMTLWDERSDRAKKRDELLSKILDKLTE